MQRMDEEVEDELDQSLHTKTPGPVAAICDLAVGHVLACRGDGAGGQSSSSACPAGVHSSRPPAAQTMYADAANYQNNRAFDLAAEEWKRFLERFADDPLAAKARHYRGVCLVQLKQYVEAVAEFQAVISKYPQFELLEDVVLEFGLVSIFARGGRRQGPVCSGGGDVYEDEVGLSGGKEHRSGDLF